MRPIFSTIGFVLFIALFVHGFFMVTGIAPRTTQHINNSILALATQMPSMLFAQVSTVEEANHNSSQSTGEQTATPDRPSSQSTEPPTIIATTTNVHSREEEYIGIVESQETRTKSAPPLKRQPLAPEYTPIRVRIPSIAVDAEVIVPSGTDPETLDSALTQGVVYYPDSGRVGKPGNAFLFGHSSWLPVVRNRNFKVFNELGQLKAGDRIIVSTTRNDFTYVVKSTRVANQDEVWVSFIDSTESILTLSTCNSFGAKVERIVVEAELVSSS